MVLEQQRGDYDYIMFSLKLSDTFILYLTFDYYALNNKYATLEILRVESEQILGINFQALFKIVQRSVVFINL